MFSLLDSFAMVSSVKDLVMVSLLESFAMVFSVGGLDRPTSSWSP